MATDHEELLRLRDRVHAIASDVATLKITAALQAKRCDLVEATVEEMTEHDKTSEAFAAGMKAARSELFSAPAKITGVLVGVCSIVAVSLQVARVAGWLG